MSLMEAVDLLKRAASLLRDSPMDTSTGVCMCGDDMKTHADPYISGHSPVDSGNYHASRLVEDIEQFLFNRTPRV